MYSLLRIICTITALMACGCGQYETGAIENGTISGPLTVKYTVSTFPTKSNGGTIEDVTCIELHGGIVAVRLEDGSGRLFSASQLHHFSWSRPKEHQISYRFD